MKIVFLGTGGSLPSKERALPAIGIRREGEVLLFDCGEGTQRQLMYSPLSFMRITKIFISHFHGDHFLGLAGLIQTMAFNGRREPIEIYGPEGAAALVKSILNLGYFPRPFDIHVHELSDGSCVDFDGYQIKTCAVKHTVPSLAYCLQEVARQGKFNKQKALELGVPEGHLFRKLQQGESVKLKDGRLITPDMVLGQPRAGRKIVYSSDTRPCEKIIALSQNCDVLIHDATLESEMSEFAEKYGHSTSRQAAEVAQKANAEKLFLFHISPRYKNDDAIVLEKEAREVFPNTTLARDLMEYDVPLKNGDADEKKEE